MRFPPAVVCVFLILLFLPAPAHALHGDWTSAGGAASPLPPYDPPYGFEYSCQAELSDGEKRRGDGKQFAREDRYEVVAVFPFTLDRDHRWLNLKDAKWSWVAVRFGADGRVSEVPLAEKARKPFVAEGVSASLQLIRGARPETDGIELYASVSLKLGKYSVTRSENASATRGDADLSLQVENSAEEQGKDAPLSRILFVDCHKEK